MHTGKNDESPREAADLEVYHPPSLAHADRAAHRLLEHYRKRTLAECRRAVARMYGHPDWPALEAAVASGDEPSAFDDEVSEQAVQSRRAHQRDVVLETLAGVTAEQARAAESLERLLFAPGAHSIGQRYDPQHNRNRIERARYAHSLAYARQAVESARATDREPVSVPRDDDDIDLVYRVDLLPRALKSWVSHHRPLLERWGGMIGQLRVRQRCPADLLNFSFAWGELCLLHDIDIPKALQVYPVALCAQWYAWLSSLATPALSADMALLESAEAEEAERQRARHALRRAIRELESSFLLAQPREDFRLLSASAREQQMHAGHAAIRRYMSDAASEHTIKTILSKPSWLSPMPA